VPADGEKSPKIVKAAVLPVLVRASRLSAARPPPVAGLNAVYRKFVGVARAARVMCELVVRNGGRLSSPLRWQPMHRTWFAAGPRPSAAVCGVVKKVSPSSIEARSSPSRLG
jgi:hypothetical protein